MTVSDDTNMSSKTKTKSVHQIQQHGDHFDLGEVSFICGGQAGWQGEPCADFFWTFEWTEDPLKP